MTRHPLAAVLAAALMLGAVGSVPAQPPPTSPAGLGVLRFAPQGRAVSPRAEITVTFDRPVARALGDSAALRRAFAIAPAVPGRLEWRDPTTLRFTPAAPLRPNASYTVTVAAGLRAADGASLAEPYVWTFAVTAPRLLYGAPVAYYNRPVIEASTRTFQLLWSAPVELSSLGSRVYLQFAAPCEGARRVALRAVSQRPLSAADPREFFSWGQERGESQARVVELAAASPLPELCAGMLIAPAALDDPETRHEMLWPFRTSGPVRLTSATCQAPTDLCPQGPLQLRFTTPVRGSEILRHVRLTPGVAFTVADSTAEREVWELDAVLRPSTRYVVTVDTALRDVFGRGPRSRQADTVTTTRYYSAVSYTPGLATIERAGGARGAVLPVRHVNVDTLLVTLWPVPDSLEGRMLTLFASSNEHSWGAGRATLDSLPIRPVVRRIPVGRAADRVVVTRLDLDALLPPAAGRTTLVAASITGTPIRPAADQAPRAGETAQQAERRRQLAALLRRFGPPVALLQRAAFAVHARTGERDGTVWVTDHADGSPRRGAAVALHGPDGRVRASGVTDAEGLARLTMVPGADSGARANEDEAWMRWYQPGTYVSVAHEGGRVLTPTAAGYGGLTPAQFAGYPGRPDQGMAAAVFTERGIYRPGEPLHAMAVLREGPLGALRAPAAGDSVRWVVSPAYDEDAAARDTTVALSRYGTTHLTLAIPAAWALGAYQVSAQTRRRGAWRSAGSTQFTVAEYRAPEFAVEVTAAGGASINQGPTAPRHPGDTVRATIAARYLFGAPMGRAPVQWNAMLRQRAPWDVIIPNADGYVVGHTAWSWWDSPYDRQPDDQMLQSGTDTLDADGRLALELPVPPSRTGAPATVVVQAGVTDLNRQTVGAAAAFQVHPAAFYVGARPRGREYFWTAGKAYEVEVTALRPDGARVAGVAVRAALVRQEPPGGRRVRVARAGANASAETRGDTVARCVVTTTADPARPALCAFTPSAGGPHTIVLTATDSAGRDARTTFTRWVMGAGGRGWWMDDEQSPHRLALVADRPRYAAGDTATLFYTAPFDGEAWVTVEREGVIEQRRTRMRAGEGRLAVPLSEAHAPNVYISVVLARGRTAGTAAPADSGRPALRVGYAELRVAPDAKRLAVEVAPAAAEYRPGDSAVVRVRVRDGRGAGARSEVTLWAVDEGVLALTGYEAPDLVELLYQPRTLGLRLASSLTSLLPESPPGLANPRWEALGDARQASDSMAIGRLERRVGAAGGRGLADASANRLATQALAVGVAGAAVAEQAPAAPEATLRARFATTAFFVGGVETGADGGADARVRLPDNLTTFRLVAVAVGEGDRYGTGEGTLLVTRPLAARASLPRVIRPGDEITAGVVVTRRDGAAGDVTVRAEVAGGGTRLRSAPAQQGTLEAGRGRELRFDFRGPQPGAVRAGGRPDTAVFRFRAASGAEADAVEATVAVKPDYRPLAHVASGVLRDTADVELALGGDVDPERSVLTLTLGTSALAVVEGAHDVLDVYPYWCSEQVASMARPLIALYRARRDAGRDSAGLATMRRKVEAAVGILVRRQRGDGAIGFWSVSDWSSPWLSAYAGEVLLDARDAGIEVGGPVLDRLADYLADALDGDEPHAAGVRLVSRRDSVRLALGHRVAAMDFLTRAGRAEAVAGPAGAALRRQRELLLEDRARLAEVLVRLGRRAEARRLLAPIWAATAVQGRRAVIRDSTLADDRFYFYSSVRPVARLLTATLAVDSAHRLVAPLVETLVRQGSAARAWNTQDYGAAVGAIAALERRQRRAAAGGVVLRAAAGGRVLARRETLGSAAGADSAVPLAGLVGRDGRLRLRLEAADAAGGVYYAVTVHAAPRAAAERPADAGIGVERWYERFGGDRAPIVGAAEGELVRVRLRVTVPADRQFVVLDDPLPGGLEAVDLSLRTSDTLEARPAAATTPPRPASADYEDGVDADAPGRWYGGWWSPWEHREIRDDRVVWSARWLPKGSYVVTYIARATTAGTFVRMPAHAEEMYNPAVHGRSDGGAFTVRTTDR